MDNFIISQISPFEDSLDWERCLRFLNRPLLPPIYSLNLLDHIHICVSYFLSLHLSISRVTFTSFWWNLLTESSTDAMQIMVLVIETPPWLVVKRTSHSRIQTDR